MKNEEEILEEIERLRKVRICTYSDARSTKIRIKTLSWVLGYQDKDFRKQRLADERLIKLKKLLRDENS